MELWLQRLWETPVWGDCCSDGGEFQELRATESLVQVPLRGLFNASADLTVRGGEIPPKQVGTASLENWSHGYKQGGVPTEVLTSHANEPTSQIHKKQYKNGDGSSATHCRCSQGISDHLNLQGFGFDFTQS